MKKIAIITIVLMSNFLLLAQPPAPGSYVTNSDIDKFVGTWQWVSGQDIITIKLAKFRHTVSNYDEDLLLGSHSYVKNGIMIESSMEQFDSIAANHKKNSIYLWNDPSDGADKVQGLLKDISKSKRVDLLLEYVGGATPTLIWHMAASEGVYVKPNFQYGLTMPTDIVLTKP